MTKAECCSPHQSPADLRVMVQCDGGVIPLRGRVQFTGQQVVPHQRSVTTNDVKGVASTGLSSCIYTGIIVVVIIIVGKHNNNNNSTSLNVCTYVYK